jgi:phosphatidylglycerophosphate synthase
VSSSILSPDQTSLIDGEIYVLREAPGMDTTRWKIVERRPIATRNNLLVQRFVGWLVRRGVSANLISVWGMVLGCLAGGLLYMTGLEGWSRGLLWVLAAALIQLRLLANLLDGMVAVESGTVSPVGELYNEIPDRVSDVAILIGAGFASGALPVIGFAASSLALFTAYVRAAGKAAGAHQEFCGPMAKPQRMFFVTCGALYAGIAPMDWQPVVNLQDWTIGLMGIILLLVCAGSLVTSVRRLLRIASALREKGSA